MMTGVNSNVITLTIPNNNGIKLDSLGDLWDCRTSTGLSLNIFDQSVLEDVDKKYLESLPVNELNYTLSRVRDANGKADTFQISVEIKFELAGVITVEGAASFTKENSKKFEEEEFFCKYDVQTFIVRTRPSVLDPENHLKLIRQDVKDKILKNQSATHYVSEIRLGGYAIASLRIKDTMSHDLMDLSGAFGGSMPIMAGISLGIKAKLAFLDSKDESSYSKSINLTFLPGPVGGMKPNTTKEMFEILDNFPKAVEGAAYLEDVFKSPPIYGIPIYFKLSPLTHLFGGNEIPNYNLLENEILAQFTDMIFTLHDFHLEDYIQSLMINKDPRLLFFFSDLEGKEPNPWTKEILKYQDEVKTKAENLKQEAETRMKAYKMGKAELEDIKQLIIIFYKEFNPNGILDQVSKAVSEGKTILNGIRPSDALYCGVGDLFIFSPSQLKDEWDNDTEEARLFLRTNGAPPPGGVHINLYSIASSVQTLGIKVRVICPNLVQDFSLAYKIKGQIVEFRGDEIIFAIHFLKQITLAKKRRHSNSSIFYSILSPLVNLNPLDEFNLLNLGSFIQAMQTQMNDWKITYCTNSFLQTLEAITALKTIASISKIITFLLPIQFLSSSWEMIYYFKNLTFSLRNAGIEYQTIVGCFDFNGDRDSPLLIAFDPNSTLSPAICLNQLDFLILEHLLINGQGLEILSAENLQEFSLSSLKLDLSFQLVNLLASTDFTLTTRGSPFEKFENSNFPPTSFLNAKEIIQAACFSPGFEIVGILANHTTNKFEGNILPIFKKYGWTAELGFPMETDWESFKQALEDLKENYEFKEDEVILFILLLNGINFAAEGNKIELVQPCLYFVDKYFNPSNTKDENISQSEIKEELESRNFLEALRLIELLRYNCNFKLFWDSTNKELIDFKDLEKLKKCLEVIGNFEFEEEVEWIWRNPKFQFWVDQFKDSKLLIATIYKLFISSENRIPDWIPASLRSQLQDLIDQVENVGFEWLRKWEDLSEMLICFRSLVSRKVIPIEFTQVLLSNILDNPLLLCNLEQVGAAFYWDNEDKHFNNAWGLAEISEALQLLLNLPTINRTTTAYEYLQVLQVPPLSPLEKQEESVSVNSIWQAFTGGTFKPIQFKGFSMIQRQVENPSYIGMERKELESFSKRVLPFICQHLKQSNTNVFNGQQVAQYIDYQIKDGIHGSIWSNSDENPTLDFHPFQMSQMLYSSLEGCFGGISAILSNSNYQQLKSFEEETPDFEFYLSRSDLITILLTKANPIVIIHLLTLISRNGNFSLPWFIPDITKEVLSMINLTDYLQYIDLSPHFPSNSSPFNLMNESRIFVPPFKLITCLKIGSNPIGKSTILNSSLLNNFQFSFKFEPGYENGKPLSRDGLVELIWLSDRTSQSDFYNNVLQDYYVTHGEIILIANVHGETLDFPPTLFDSLRKQTGAFLVFWKCSSWTELQKGALQLKELVRDIPTYNLILDPHKSISAKVNEEIIIQTKKPFEVKFQQFFKSLLYKTASSMTILNSPPPQEEDHDSIELTHLISFIQNHSIEDIKGCMTYPNIQDNNKLWIEAMSLFYNLISLPFDKRLEELYKFQLKLAYLSKKSSEPSLRKVIKLEEQIKKSEYKDSKLIQLLRFELIKYNQLILTPINFFREMEKFIKTEEREVYPRPNQKDQDYIKIYCEIFHSGFPLEFLNLSNPSSEFNKFNSSSIQACFDSLRDNKVKIFVLSIMGTQEAQNNYKSILIDSLFGPDSHVAPCERTNDGIIMRLLYLDDETLGDQLGNNFDAVLLLESQSFGQSENVLNEEAASREKQITTFLLAVSHLSILIAPSNSNANIREYENWKDILEISLSAFGLIEESYSLQPNLLIINPVNSSSPIMNPKQKLGEEILNILTSIEKNSSNQILQFGTKSSTLTALENIWNKALNQELIFDILDQERKTGAYFQSINKLHNLILNSIQQTDSRLEGESDWYNESNTIWTKIDSSNHDLFGFQNLSQLNKKFELQISQDKLKSLLDLTFLRHEEIFNMEKETGKELKGLQREEQDKGIIGRVPYACTLQGNQCPCSETVFNIQEIFNSIENSIKINSISSLELDLLREELDSYSFQLKNSIIARSEQSAFAIEISIGFPGGALATYLKELSHKNNAINNINSVWTVWSDFKQFVSTKSFISPWKRQILMEINEEYNNAWISQHVKLGILPILNKLSAFDRKHKRNINPIDESKTINVVLNWEQAIWLRLQLNAKVKAFCNLWSYHQGAVRELKASIQSFIENEFMKIQCPNMILLAEFLWTVHSYALILFVQGWEDLFVDWMEENCPLMQLVSKKEEFPNIFKPPSPLN